MSTKVTQALVPSKSDPSKTYTIRIFRDEDTNELEYKCSCPHFVFRNTDCKHILNTKMLVDKGTIKPR